VAQIGRRFRGVLLDYGGVMTSSVGASFAAFCLENGVDPERFKDVVAAAYGEQGGESMIAGVERGTMPVDDFERWLAGTLSEGLTVPVPAAGLRHRLFTMAPDAGMTEAVRAARASGIRTGLVSNTWGSPPAERRRQIDGLFDVVVRSDEVAMRKPEPGIYLLAAERLGLDPRECVFVDDLAQNVDGARAVGMEGIVHRSAEFTVPRLEQLFGMRVGDVSGTDSLGRGQSPPGSGR
jgi:putative hydrolase of the HAD superfamily